MRGGPVISVIVTTYQRRALVGGALASVFAQTVRDREVIVVDDGSTDGTGEFLRTQPVSVVSLPHSGNPGVARNAGLARANGELIAFLDSDDVWRPTALAELAAALHKHPEAGFAYCGYEPPLDPTPELPLVGDVFDQLLDLDFIMTSGMLVRRSVADAVGEFDPRCTLAEDWDYWLRMAARFPGAYVPRPLLDIGESADSLSRAPGGAIYGSNIRVTRKALAWCLRHRPASVRLARRSYRRSLMASARYHWHAGAIARTVHDLATVALAR
jgi:glycosyltransferase involved in cell wall biosynthesis